MRRLMTLMFAIGAILPVAPALGADPAAEMRYSCRPGAPDKPGWTYKVTCTHTSGPKVPGAPRVFVFYVKGTPAAFYAGKSLVSGCWHLGQYQGARNVANCRGDLIPDSVT